MKYIFEGEVRDKDSEMVGRLRYFFKADNDIIAKSLVETIKNSLEKGLSPYYGEDPIKITNLSKLENLE